MPPSDTALKRAVRATSYDVAVAAGVAQSTVSRCFVKDSPISPDTRAHVLAVAEELNYRPNALARSLILGRSHVVGVVVTNYTLRHNPDVLYMLGEALAAANSKLLLIAVDSDDAVHETLGNALDFPLDGLISCANMALKDIQAFQQHGVPVVFFNRHVGAKGVDSVSTNHAAATRDIGEALYRAGHRRFLCIGGPEGAPVSEARLSGITQRLRELGAPAPRVAYSDFSYENGSAVLLEQMEQSGGKIDAVFCANDQIALGVMDACRFSLSKRVPEDVSIVGFDDITESARPTYLLTTVRQDVRALANEAVKLLATRLVSPERRARSVSVPGVLIERASARLTMQ